MCVCVCKSVWCVCGVCVCVCVCVCVWCMCVRGGELFGSVQLWVVRLRMRGAHPPSAPEAPMVGEPREIGRESLNGHSACHTMLCSAEGPGVWCLLALTQGIPRWCFSEESACQCRRCKRSGFDPWVRKIPWRRKWQPTPAFLPRKSQGQSSLAGCCPWSRSKKDMT